MPLKTEIGAHLSRSTTGLNLEFSSAETGSHTKVKEPSLPYYSLIAGVRIFGLENGNSLILNSNKGNWTNFGDNSYVTSASVKLYQTLNINYYWIEWVTIKRKWN